MVSSTLPRQVPLILPRLLNRNSTCTPTRRRRSLQRPGAPMQQGPAWQWRVSTLALEHARQRKTTLCAYVDGLLGLQCFGGLLPY